MSASNLKGIGGRGEETLTNEISQDPIIGHHGRQLFKNEWVMNKKIKELNLSKFAILMGIMTPTRNAT